jgi:hypothetical protein
VRSSSTKPQVVIAKQLFAQGLVAMQRPASPKTEFAHQLS